MLPKLRPNNLDEINAFFLSIKFKASSVQHLPGFKDYDYESSWNIQVGVYDGKGREVHDGPENHKPIIDSHFWRYVNDKLHTPDKDSSKWRIIRHKDFGETPSFRWRSDTSSSEYKYEI